MAYTVRAHVWCSARRLRTALNVPPEMLEREPAQLARPRAEFKLASVPARAQMGSVMSQARV
jgi:hypothetical protein